MKKIAALLAAALALTLLCCHAEETVYADLPTVRAVQEALNGAGYDCGEPDGVAGRMTFRAIAAYQADHQLEQTGEITDSLLASLGVEPVSPEEDAQADAPVELNGLPVGGWEEQPITFEGIPWGFGVSEAAGAMVEGGLVDSASEAMFIQPIVWMSEPTELAAMAYQWPSVDLSRTGETYFYENIRRGIAGYVPATVYMSFLYGESGGKVVEDGRLNGVVVEYIAGDYGITRERLFEALTVVLGVAYGQQEPEALPEEKGWCAVWNGPDNTAVALVLLNDERLAYTGQEDCVELFFGKTDAYSLANALKGLL